MQQRRGSVVRRQGPIQVDIVRMMGGGQVRSVRGKTHAIDPSRPIDGSFTAFLEFEEGHAATITYNGYGHFDSSELTFGYTLQGFPTDPGLHARTRRRIHDFGGIEEEKAFKESIRYGGSLNRSIEYPVKPDRRQAFFGLTLVSCELGDIRQTPTGVVIHGDEGTEHISVYGGEGYNRRYGEVEVDEMHAGRLLRTGRCAYTIITGARQRLRLSWASFSHQRSVSKSTCFTKCHIAGWELASSLLPTLMRRGSRSSLSKWTQPTICVCPVASVRLQFHRYPVN